jgi:hypothetical protein
VNDKFVYDEKTSRLYAPDGKHLKKVLCPKAMHWNQLLLEDGQDRWRGCTHCQQRVVNLDVMDVGDAVKLLARQGRRGEVCVQGSEASGRVIFLKDDDALCAADDASIDERGRVVIQTARSIFDINRAASLGYWPDVRLVQYDVKSLHSKVSVGQHAETGRVDIFGDYRFGPGDELFDIEADLDLDDEGEVRAAKKSPWVAVIPFTSYYPYYQGLPIAAYLIPRGLPDGTFLLVNDPIEDLVGAVWNQGDSYRAAKMNATLSDGKVVLGSVEKSEIRRFVG